MKFLSCPHSPGRLCLKRQQGFGKETKMDAKAKQQVQEFRQLINRETFCLKTLQIRGWNPWLIASFLGQPDTRTPNKYSQQHPQKRWLITKVLQAEKHPLVQAAIQKHKANRYYKRLKEEYKNNTKEM